MPSYQEKVLAYLDSQGVRYTELNADVDTVVQVVFRGNNKEKIRICMTFGLDDEPSVQFRCDDIGRFVRTEMGCERCNETNKRWRWVRFYADENGEIIADLEVTLTPDTCGEECAFLLRKMAQTIDEAYPLIARTVCF